MAHKQLLFDVEAGAKVLHDADNARECCARDTLIKVQACSARAEVMVSRWSATMG